MSSPQYSNANPALKRSFVQLAADPLHPLYTNAWILAQGQVGKAGQAMGPMGMTYSRTEVEKYLLSYCSINGDILRMELTRGE